MRRRRGPGCSLALLVPGAGELGVLTFTGIRRGDRVQQFAGDRFGVATYRPYRGEADQAVQGGGAPAGSLVQVAPVPAGPAAGGGVGEPDRGLQGGGPAEPPAALLLCGRRQGPPRATAQR